MQSAPPLWSFRSTRLKVAVYIGFALYAAVSMRASLSMGIVCMVNSTAYTQMKIESSDASDSSQTEIRLDVGCPSSIDENATDVDEYNGKLLWPPSQQTILFSASYYGSLATMLVSGSIADKFGPKRMLTASIAMMVVLTLFAPYLAQLSYWAYYASRVLLGMAEGFIIPSTNAMGGRWFPPNEKSAMAALYTSGNQIAAGTSGLIGSWLCKLPFLEGWPVIFYLFGTIGIVWFIGWNVIVSDHPSGNRWIRPEEEEYLQGRVVAKSKMNGVSIPWSKIIQSREVHACLLCNFTFSFLVSINQNLLPLYFKDELMLPLSINGLYTVIPFLTQLIMKNILASAADHLKASGKMSPTHVVKLFQAFASFGTASILVCLALFPSCHRPWLVAVLLFFYGIFFAGGICGFFTSLISIAPAYAGTLTSMSMGCGQLASIIATSTVAAITYQGWPHKWLIVFSIGAALQIVTGIFFIVFGSGEAADWGMVEQSDTNTSKVNELLLAEFPDTTREIEQQNVTGFVLNLLLLFAILRFSNAKLGAYKHLLAIFTAADICLVILHEVVKPRAVLVGTTHGVVTDTVLDDRRITALYVSLQSVPFILLNIHFLYRYWVARRPHLIVLFSRYRFILALISGSLGALIAWYLLCLKGTTGQVDSAGRRDVVDEYERKYGKRIENAWIRDEKLDVSLLFTFLLINILMTSSLILASSLAYLTFYHIRKVYQLSTQAGRLQNKLLIALCAQASVPTIFVYIPYLVTINIPFWRLPITVLHDFGAQFTTFFPVLDAALVILLIADYRRGLMGMIRKRPEQNVAAIVQFST